eukprot:3678827-Rhodomonas_salina.1
MSGTDIRDAATRHGVVRERCGSCLYVLRVCYAVSGTDTVAMLLPGCGSIVRGDRSSGTSLRAPYAMPGTDMPYVLPGSRG